MNTNTVNSGNPVPCGHWPPMLAVISTRHGYKVRCLTCGQTGPERENTDLAWTALIRSPEEAGGGEGNHPRRLRAVPDDGGRGNRERRR